MELIDYTNKWVSGEIMEDFAMIVGGVFCIVLALVAWRWGTSEYGSTPVIVRETLCLPPYIG